MAKKPKKKTAGFSEVSWGNQTTSQTMTVQAIRALDKSLSPSDAYQLSIDVRACIEARAGTLAQCRLRLFWRKSGDEIIGGDLWKLFKRPAPYWNTRSMVYELASNYHLYGEMALNISPGNSYPIAGLLPLNPSRLRILKPYIPRDRAEIEQWQYLWENGTILTINAPYLAFEKNFNPMSHVRGISPILAGIHEVGSSYYGLRYFKKFMENDAVPSHIVVVPAGTNAEDREGFKEEYMNKFSSFGGNNAKIWVVEADASGAEQFKMIPIESPQKPDKFMAMIPLTTQRIQMLYKVPPIEAGNMTDVRFDSADAQREMFFETAILRDAKMMSGFFQHQVIDQFLTGTNQTDRNEKPKMGKRLKSLFEEAMDNNLESDIIVVLDPDELPIVSKLKQSKVEYAQKLQTTFRMTPKEAAEEIGFEVEETDASNMVWYSSTDKWVNPNEINNQPIGDTIPNSDTVVQATQDSGEELEPHKQPEPDEEPSEEEIDNKSIREMELGLRKLVLEQYANNKMFGLSQADDLNKTNNKLAWNTIRQIYVEVERHLENKQPIEDVKKNILNKILNKNWLK